MNPNFQENLIERKNRLKYFYLIDIDSLGQNIRTGISKLEGKHTFNKFEYIFDMIYRSECNRYFKFLIAKQSFNFSLPRSDSFLSSSAYIFQIILRNHCILYGFNEALNRENKTPIQISNKLDAQNKRGYYSTSPLNNFGTLTPQDYYKYKKRFQKHEDNYSYYCLSTKYCIESPNDFPLVLKHNAPFARFLFTESLILTFDKNIGNYLSLKHYTELANLMLSVGKKNLSDRDSLIFDYSAENIYGFSFFHAVFKLLNCIYGETNENPSFINSDFKITPADLMGKVTLDLISQTARLPMVYNKYFFLQYALYNILSSEKLERHTLSLNRHPLFKQITETPSSKPQLILDGLSRAIYYMQNIHYILLPFLEDLWSVITLDFLNMTLSDYMEYIDSNPEYLTFDFSSYDTFDYEEISRFILEESKEHIRKKIEKDSKNPPKKAYNLNPEAKPAAVTLLKDFLSSSRIDSMSRNTIDQLLNNSADRKTPIKYLKSKQLETFFDFVSRLPS